MRFSPSQLIANVLVVGTFVTQSKMAAAEDAKKNITRPDPEIPLAPVPLPTPGPARDGKEIVRQLMGLTRASIDGGGGPEGGSRLRLVKKVELEGELWEPEGIVRLAGRAADGGGEGGLDDDEERFWVSAGEYTVPTEKFPGGRWVDGTDRSAGAGFAHFVIFDGRGRRLGDWVVSEEGGLEYHNGGLDYDGKHIWATLSQYRPNTTGTVVKIDPTRLEMDTVFRVGDHQGGIVHDVETGTLTTLNWGGRKARRWDLKKARTQTWSGVGMGEEGQVRLGDSTDAGDGREQNGADSKDGREGFDKPEREMVNPSYWIDYQDCKSLGRVDGRSLMLCSGIATLAAGVEVGGLAVVDAEGMVPLWEVPFMERTGEGAGGGVLMTKNPMDVALVRGRVRLYFAPEEKTSSVFVYEVSEG